MRRGPGHWCNAIALAALIALLSACSKFDDSEKVGPWLEEVKLTDGQVVLIERTMTFEYRGSIGGPVGQFTESATIRLVKPENLSHLPVLRIPFRPLVLEFDPEQNVWLVIALNDKMCWGIGPYSGYRLPDGSSSRPDFEFHLVDGRWLEVPLSPQRVGQDTNLLVPLDTVPAAPKVIPMISLDMKASMNDPAGRNISTQKVASRLRCGT